MPVKISLACASVRPNRWKEIYNNLYDTKVDFEIVFVGPYESSFKLPRNVRHYKSSVKPSQAFEAACRFSNGEYVLPIADDLKFSSHFLDKMYHYTETNDMNNTFIIPVLTLAGRNKPLALHYKLNKDYPVLGLTLMMKKTILNNMRGIDNRFIYSCWNWDIALRFISDNYGRSVVAYDCITDEILYRSVKTLRSEWYEYDLDMITELWEDEKGGLLHKRKYDVNPFLDEGILDKTQGNNGCWE